MDMPERNDDFDQMLDECYDRVKIGDIEFFPSQILYDCDPIAYRVYLSDYLSNQEQCECGQPIEDGDEECEDCKDSYNPTIFDGMQGRA